MKISVIVPAFNEEKLITATLQSIQQSFVSFSRLGWQTELLVCDNNSSDRTGALAREAGAVVVFEPVNQIARARNSGARAATGDWLIFVDADSQPTEGLFGDVAKIIQSGKYAGGGSTLRMQSDSLLGRLIVRGWNRFSRLTTCLAGSFVFCEARAFRELGGFSEKLYISEELDLTRRLKRWARAQGKRMTILHRHPMLTSARKLHLYSKREHLRFLARLIFSFGKPLQDPKECFVWYDGRR